MPTAAVSPARDPRLHGIVETLWCAPGQGAGHHERVVPSGRAHLVWRVGAPIRIAGGPTLAEGALAGPRATAHVHHTSDAWSVGVVLHPGAIPRLFGVRAVETADRHVDLASLLGADAGRLQEQLEEAPGVERVEDWLLARLGATRRPGALGPARAGLACGLTPTGAGLGVALAALARGSSVADAARAAGRSPRTLRLWFEEAVGLSPAAWRAVRRVRRAMDLAAVEPDGARLAARAGYADQPHLCHEFKAVVGVPLGVWRRHHRPGEPAHVREPAHRGERDRPR